MLYIFDLDGTLRKTKSGRPCPNSLGDQELLPNVKEVLKAYSKSGAILAGCSNQGGVSCGFMTEEMALAIHNETNELTGNLLSMIELCFYHPNGQFKDRYLNNAKPKPDMVFSLMLHFKTGVDHTLFIGNEYTDQECAENAGINFAWANDFFLWKEDVFLRTDRGIFPREVVKNE